MARLGHFLTSTSTRLGSELERLAAEMGGKGSEDKGNAPARHQVVQARFALIPWPVHPIHAQNLLLAHAYPPQPYVSHLFQRCKWSSRRARPS